MNDTLERLVQEYRQSFRQKAEDIQNAWQQAKNGRWRQETVTELISLIHKLAGSSGAYGIQELHDLTKKVNGQLKEIESIRHDEQALEALETELDQLVRYLGTTH